MEIDITDIILQEFQPVTEEQEKIKLYLQTHKGNCEEYITTSSKYKKRVICIKSIYHSIKVDLLADINIQINK